VDRCITLVAVAVAALAISAPTASAVTVGAPLDVAANTNQGCEGFLLIPAQPSNCTFFGLDSAGAFTSQTPPGVWVINQARVRTGPRVGPMVFTALRALRSKAGTEGIACCTAAAESQVFVPQPNAINTIPVNMPVVNTVELVDNEQIEIVDYLGITLLTPGSSAPLNVTPGATAVGSYFIPALRSGQTGAGPGTFGARVLINAEYQPAPPGTPTPSPTLRLGPGVQLLRRGTRARLGAAVPGPGLLRAVSAARGRAAAAASASKAKRPKVKKKKLVHDASVRAKQAGDVKITLRLTPTGRKLLAKRKRLKLRVALTFKPSGGGASVRQSRKVTFKRPAAKRRGGKQPR
jgi:hypothetical protein